MSTTDFLKDLHDAIGENDGAEVVTQFIDTGFPPLNQIISGRKDGGLPFGRMVEMFGFSSSGKTALATQWMVEAQRMGGFAGFEDWERSFNADLARTFGLNTDPKVWRYQRPRTWESGNMDATKTCQLIRQHKVIPDSAPILFVFDSIASAIPQSVAEKEISEHTMNDNTALARVSSATLKVQSQYAADFNATFLYLNQLREKPGVVYGDPRYTPGGKAMEFYASARLSLGRSKVMEGTGSDKEFVGQEIGIECTKSKFTKPFQKCSLRMSFDDLGAARFDFTRSMLDYAVAEGLIAYSKPRATWLDGKQYFLKALAEKIDAEGLQGELKKLVMA